MSGVFLLARLVFATGVVLAPGWLLARALGVRSASAVFAWSLTLVFAAGAITFAAGTSLTLTLVLLLAVGAAASQPVAEGAVQQTLDRFGRIDAVVNCAGGAGRVN